MKWKVFFIRLVFSGLVLALIFLSALLGFLGDPALSCLAMTIASLLIAKWVLLEVSGGLK